MELIFCTSCGVVLNLKAIDLPDMYDDEGRIDDRYAAWEDKTFKPAITCPVCKEKIIIG